MLLRWSRMRAVRAGSVQAGQGGAQADLGRVAGDTWDRAQGVGQAIRLV